MCCFMRCRIPRTVQEIDADVNRKKLTKQFTKHLEKVSVEVNKLEDVLPQVITLEKERIMNGIREEEMTFWKKIKKMITSQSIENIEQDVLNEKKEEEEPDDEEDSKDVKKNDEVTSQLVKNEGDEDEKKSFHHYNEKVAINCSLKNVTQATNKSCVNIVVDGGIKCASKRTF